MNREEQLLALVPPALAAADRAAAEAIEKDRARRLTPSCRKGCGACCRYLVRISLAEVLHLRRVVERLEDGHRQRVLARSAAIRAAAEEAGLTEVPNDEAGVERMARRYLALDLPCPFLEDGACSIYADRPTPCRQYWVTTDAALCADPFRNNVRAVPVWPLARDRLVEECAAITGEQPRARILSLL